MYKPGLYNTITYILSIIIIILLSSCQTKKINKESKIYSKRVEVAIMVPLSNELSEQGKKIAELMQIGLQQGQVVGNINVTIYDVSTQALAQYAMDKVIAKKTKVILGPISSSTTKSIANLAAINNIPLISLSNDPSLANNHVLVFGHAPVRQTEQLFHFLLKKGHKDFILLLPKTQFSHNTVNIIQKILSQNNGNLTHIEFYSQNNLESINNAINNIIPIIEELNEKDDDLKPAVYIADEQKYIPNLTTLLEQFNITSNAVVFGDNKLHIDYKHNINVIYTGSLNIMHTPLPQILKGKFGTDFLNFLELLAYDAGFITAKVMSNSTSNFLLKLTRPIGHWGVSGNVRFNGYIAERKYDIIKREHLNFTILNKTLNFINN